MTTLINLAVPITLIDAIAGTGDSDVFALPAKVAVLSWQTSFDNAPDAVEINLQVSIDGINFSIIDTSTDVDGEVRVLTGVIVALFIKVVVVTDTGGSEVTVTLLTKESP